MSFKVLFSLLVLILLSTSLNQAYAEDFTQEDRERLVRIETTLQVFMEQIDKRFEQVDKRFEQIDRRFDDVNKRIDEVNKRLDLLTTFLWILAGIFTTLTATVIGFAYWDRRTIIRRAREESLDYFEREGKFARLLEALKEFAKEDERLAKILRSHGLL
ncbi:hypothetical protein [Thermodesulfatator atlanticus]|uniref:hypothetical protein n=1 Tax=Thermodesulfatator atlanticus TaxID=501497 RepID=UPI0003B63554|nr:hypothetical protein [Thermodesulfatator atlanticus]